MDAVKTFWACRLAETEISLRLVGKIFDFDVRGG